MTKFLGAAVRLLAAVPYCIAVLAEAAKDPVELEIQQWVAKTTVSDLFEEISNLREAS